MPSDPFDSSGPVIGGASSNRFGWWLLAVLVLAGLGVGGWWVATQLGGDDNESTQGASPTSVAQSVEDPSETAPSSETSPVPETSGAPETAVTAPATAVVAPPEMVTYFDGTAARLALDTVAAEVGGNPFRVLDVVLYPTYVILEAQDADELDFVDRVVWRDGGIQSRDPVRLFPGTDLDLQLFTLDDVSWDAVGPLVASAVELTEVRDGEVTHVVVNRPVPFSNDVRFRVFVDGPRTSGFVDADATGSVLNVSKG